MNKDNREALGVGIFLFVIGIGYCGVIVMNPSDIIPLPVYWTLGGFLMGLFVVGVVLMKGGR